MKILACELKIMMMGGVAEKSSGSTYCTLITINEEGELINRHRKIKPTYGLIWVLRFDLGPAVTINLIVGLNPIFAVIVSLILKMENFSRLKFVGMSLCILSSILLVI